MGSRLHALCHPALQLQEKAQRVFNTSWSLFHIVMGKPQDYGIEYNCYMLLWLDIYGKYKHWVVMAKS